MIAAPLGLTANHVDQAHRFFKLALQNNFLQGRRSTHVCAACIYIVCRNEKTPHMLLDFSEILQTNVFALGHTFVRLTRLLSINLPIVDPSFYIHRFASRLEFGDKLNSVAKTALKLVASMKRDWMQTGRRPAGICAAALLLAARIHGFRRSQKEIVSTVRICDMTLRKRLAEFQDTPASTLTPEEFEALDDEFFSDTRGAGTAADPPAFTRSREKEREAAERSKKGGDEEVDEEAEEEEEEQQQPKPKLKGKKTNAKAAKGKNKRKASVLEEEENTEDTAAAEEGQDALASINKEELLDNEAQIQEEMQKVLNSDEVRLFEQDLEKADVETKKYEELRAQLKASNIDAGDEISTSTGEDLAHLKTAYGDDNTESGELPATLQYDENGEVVTNGNGKHEEEGEEDHQEAAVVEESLSDIDDEEVDTYIHTDEEVKVKEAIWNELHKEYLEQLEQKMKEQERGETEQQPKKKRRQRKKEESTGPAGSAAEATANMLAKRMSSKINYSALKGLFTIDNTIFDSTVSY
eukprot:GEZU01019819.1.p1 GENE.GEZU01019819.1~~GEZU01019819.1.p1  ORF type:complete len:525 (-),score=180.23 GEZU01019819.1:234-1808(-)